MWYALSTHRRPLPRDAPCLLHVSFESRPSVPCRTSLRRSCLQSRDVQRCRKGAEVVGRCVRQGSIKVDLKTQALGSSPAACNLAYRSAAAFLSAASLGNSRIFAKSAYFSDPQVSQNPPLFPAWPCLLPGEEDVVLLSATWTRGGCRSSGLARGR